MANLVKFESREQVDSPLSPELKEFIDRVIVPILVKQYLAARTAEDELVSSPIDVAEFPGKTAA